MLCYLIDDDSVSRLIFEKIFTKSVDGAVLLEDKGFADQSSSDQLSNTTHTQPLYSGTSQINSSQLATSQQSTTQIQPSPGTDFPVADSGVSDESANSLGNKSVSNPAHDQVSSQQQTVCLQTFSSATAALSSIRELFFKADYAALPDLIFLDIVLPYMSGWEFLDKLNALLQSIPGSEQIGPKLNSYLLTSFVNEFDLRKAKHYRLVSDCMLKPITPLDLQSIIKNTLG